MSLGQGDFGSTNLGERQSFCRQLDPERLKLSISLENIAMNLKHQADEMEPIDDRFSSLKAINITLLKVSTAILTESSNLRRLK